MVINTDNLVSITEANQNFSRVARLVDENGAAVILKNNTPRYVLIEFSQLESEQQASDEDVLAISRRLMAKNIPPLKAIPKLKTNGKLPAQRARSLRWMRIGVLGCGVTDSR